MHSLKKIRPNADVAKKSALKKARRKLNFAYLCTPTAVQFKRKLKLTDFNPYIFDKY